MDLMSNSNKKRLSGAGYCFSASLPPYLARIAERAIDIMCNEPNRLRQHRGLMFFPVFLHLQ